MYKASLIGDLDVIKKRKEAAIKAPGLMATAWRLESRRIGKDMVTELQFVPEPPAHPFVWSFDEAANARAKRWWFYAIHAGIVATDPITKRYLRTGKRMKGWHFVTDASDDGGILTVTNKEPGVEFVYGFRQVPSHELSGWPQAQGVIAKYRAIGSERLRKLWRTVVHPQV